MSNSNDKSERRKKASFSLSWGLGVFIITSMLLAGCGFALTISATTLTTTALAQEGNNITAASTPSNTTTYKYNNITVRNRVIFATSLPRPTKSRKSESNK
jgi:hypothetical protein